MSYGLHMVLKTLKPHLKPIKFHNYSILMQLVAPMNGSFDRYVNMEILECWEFKITTGWPICYSKHSPNPRPVEFLLYTLIIVSLLLCFPDWQLLVAYWFTICASINNLKMCYVFTFTFLCLVNCRCSDVSILLTLSMCVSGVRYLSICTTSGTFITHPHGSCWKSA